MKLTSENVEKVFRTCLGKKDEPYMKVEGVAITVGFDNSKIEEHREEIISMLLQLPDEFKLHHGGGMTFLNMCLDKGGRQWTGDHFAMDRLVCLGLAVDAVEFSIPFREMWKALPGGVPYITIKIG